VSPLISSPVNQYSKLPSFPSGHTEKIIRGDATRVQAQVTTPLGDTKNGIPKSCNTSVTPACLQAQYQIPTTKVTKSKSKIAVSGYNDEYANEADLQTFLTQYRPDMPPNTTFTLQTLDGGDNDQWIQYAGLEAVRIQIDP
jgi:tripeptidyl-peptidase-1